MRKKLILLGVLFSIFSCSSDDTNDLSTTETEENSYIPYIAKVFDYLPAAGQFTNKLPLWKSGDTREAMLAKVNQALVGPNPSMISLGGFGGYVVFGFDHTVLNKEGKDFKVLGNAFPNSTEPGIIMVSYDANGNGIPDDEWYEIAGSEYYKSTTIKNYSITYYKPVPNKTPVPGAQEWQTDIEYIRWKDNQGNSGYKTQNSFNQNSYFPEWISEDSITFTGTRLADNYTNTQTEENPFWVGQAYEYGYADNAPNDDENSGIDISWAVDKDGKTMELPGINFVKVYTGTNQEAGWLGEISTEVTGAYDLHLLKQ